MSGKCYPKSRTSKFNCHRFFFSNKYLHLFTDFFPQERSPLHHTPSPHTSHFPPHAVSPCRTYFPKRSVEPTCKIAVHIGKAHVGPLGYTDDMYVWAHENDCATTSHGPTSISLSTGRGTRVGPYNILDELMLQIK